MKLKGTDIALIGTMASLIVASGYIPIIPIIGTGYSISLGSVLIQVVAVLLGPLLGAITVLMGSFSGMMLTGQGFSLLFFIPATIGAMTTALFAWGKAKEAIALFACVIAVWYVSPLGIELWYYPYIHIAVLALVVAWGRFGGRIALEGDGRRIVSFTLFCTAGVLCDHLLGSAIAMFPPFELPASAYRFILFIYPVERILLGVASAIVIVPVLRAVRNSPLSTIWRGRESLPE